MVGVKVLHINDLRNMNHTSGVWFALAWHTNHGRLYPEVYDGHLYAGSRYMPLNFVAHAGIAQFTGEYLISDRILFLAVMLAGWLLLFLALRQVGCPWSGALALVAMTAVSGTGRLTSENGRGDLLAVVLQLAALYIAAGGTTSLRGAIAGLLCMLAVLTKITAGWGPLAILCWYFFRDRRACAVFLGCWLGTLLVAVGSLHFITDGRMLASFRAASDPEGTALSGFLKAPVRMVRFSSTNDGALLLLTPFALFDLVRVIVARRATIYHLAVCFCLPILLVIFSDRGTVANHLIDLVVLFPILVGSLWASRPDWNGVTPVLVAVLFWGLLSQTTYHLGREKDFLDDWKDPWTLSPYRPLARELGDGSLLSEDPIVPVLRGVDPVVLDPYTYAILMQKRPELAQDLPNRLKAHEFASIVLIDRIDDPVISNWYSTHFGPELAGAIRDYYRFKKHTGNYYIYVPR
jgi:hypothetical protein